MKKFIFIPLMLLSLSAIAYHHSGEELSPIDTVKKPIQLLLWEIQKPGPNYTQMI